MSGHSKWAQIRHKKAVTDKKRGQLFSKISRAITLAAKKGTDPKSNAALSQAIDQARAMNVPNDNIARAIKKAADKSSAQLEELIIDGIGPGGIAMRVKAITDNRNRTVADIKNILSEHESKMVPPGSIGWMLDEQFTAPDESVRDKIDLLFEALDDQEEVEDVISNLAEN
ncbi:MAG: hypothetical protein A3B99_01220 [Candidatus Yanofskybacteria bacterium RIFCSPHIGHO2_02_FULL_44_12b]|uniref:Transcriptional regulator n=2 Tax=Candidatus Yanofskyibacteriota TaxID=1752733 RepID=A0A1F8GJ48_9BACT|nr:MAG: transcriptional regulator [Candidatus Yanofskybacteria bacterium GW2011_GWA2_44_9]OGN05447.1 MAG: hypothetical protein A2659_03885 [Candidatus Yanofskybacteria bacterium RIFCSPHIGHO2_01_FULL_44_24]OGN15453.1 MAG: hypothetical protein A3B99_01220 [Candidatus Yanofskybacteria bacterium RIFCSPHIGHO2_02_FULL_44_12b]OGN25437.1 MAG: hypothetical protein A2925_00190 [Candidatus Yanofskybacteria bacterium RIFCSPLOWO2_01_FULL_44_22]